MRPRLLLQHRLEHGLGAEEHAREVGVDHLLPLGVLHAQQQVVARDAGVVRPGGRCGRGRRRPVRSPPRPTRARPRRARAPRPCPPPAWISRDRLGELARVASREHDVSTLGGERACDREADPARGARHQRYPAFEKTASSLRAGPKGGERGFERVGAVHVQHLRPLRDLPDEPAQHAARADLDEARDALAHAAARPTPASARLPTPAAPAPPRHSAPSRTTSASTLFTSGGTGSAKARAASSGARRSCAGCISAQ